MARGVASGMEYLAGMHYVHRVTFKFFVVVIKNCLLSFHFYTKHSNDISLFVTGFGSEKHFGKC